MLNDRYFKPCLYTDMDASPAYVVVQWKLMTLFFVEVIATVIPI